MTAGRTETESPRQVIACAAEAMHRIATLAGLVGDLTGEMSIPDDAAPQLRTGRDRACAVSRCIETIAGGMSDKLAALEIRYAEPHGGAP